jgi:hypothetical protein
MVVIQPNSSRLTKEAHDEHSTRSLDSALGWRVAHMALQRQLGILSERRTRLASTYPADNGFNGTAFYNVRLAD